MNKHQNGQENPKPQYITEEDLKVILTKYGYVINEIKIKHYEVNLACENKMLGILADHLILKVILISNNEQKTLNFFIKALPQDAVKALFVRSLNLFEKELVFYQIIKSKMDLPGLKPWSSKLVANLDNAIVLDDLTSLQYQMRSKDIKFDVQHALEALRTLARFHAGSIIYEETVTKNLNKPYRLGEEYGQYLDLAHFDKANQWFIQCKTGALMVVKEYSKYKNADKDLLKIIEDRWSDVWNAALDYNDSERSVICHRDLWNNNLLFHYKKREDGKLVPDDCVLVDFQAITYQPPARDVMFLLHCNLERQFRKENLNKLFEFYFDELKNILLKYGIMVEDIIPKDSFVRSAKEYNIWGLVVHASLVQVIGLDDNLMMKKFSEASQFEKVVSNDRTTYIREMVQESEFYKRKIIMPLEEIVEDYILTN
ncbi:uncharacterized protein [Choristoneura fumiferana]|uniref:uncharacterized protein n=1 Tax=Choristoneura fumiferana TaxID=7141 RepID=UPI003D15B537